MNSQLVMWDSSVSYRTKENPVIIAALAFVIAVGGLGVFAWMVCGWRGTKQMVSDWIRGRVTIVCK